MASDIKLIQDTDSLAWDIDFENGDFALTQGLDTALYMSVLCEKRALASQVSNAILRRGHFSNEFSQVLGYEVGSLLWLYANNPNTSENRLLIQDTVTEGLQWMIDDEILQDVEVEVANQSNIVTISVTLTNQKQEQSNYYLTFKNTFS